MLFLVFADRHVGRLVDEDVSGLQHGIGEQADGGPLLVLAGLVLELGHPLEPAETGHAIEDPGHFGMRRHGRLGENRALFGINAGRDIGRSRRTHRVRQGRRIVRHGDRVHVDHAVKTRPCRVFLQRHPVLQRPEIIAEMQTAGWLHAGQDAVRTFVIGGRVTHGRALRESHQEGG